MRKLLLALALCLALPLLSACAGGGGSNAVSWDGGIATEADALEAPQEILRQEQYVMERTQGAPNIYILTRWKSRSPLPDEEEVGIVEARTRFIIEGRPRSRNPSGVDLYTVRIRAESEGRTTSDQNWVAIEPTSDFREYAGRIANAIQDEIEMGTRVME